ncbi:MAG: YbbR-like domain-containing protein [Spirochaetales bacterium]|nr:YbbR-like domain-containing protein [Spirochaetales bacterium]
MLNRLSKIIERNWPAKILSVVAAIILFLFYQATNLEERFFSVPLDIIINESYSISSSIPSSVRVSLKGSEENIFMILEDDIEAYADFSTHSSEGLFKAPIKFRRTGAAENIEQLEIHIEPAELTLELERRISRQVKIQPQLIGYPEKGWELDQYLLSTEEAMVEGPKSHIEGLEFIPTEEINLDGKNSDFYLRTRLKVNDPYLTFPSGDSVGFQGIVKETVILKTFEEVGMIYIDLAPELYITGSDITGSIKVQGKQILMESTVSGDFSIIADCGDITKPGRWVVPVSPIIPAGLFVLKYTPDEITIDVQRLEKE